MKMWRLLPLAVILLAASLRANEVMPMVSGSSSIRPGAKIVFLGDSITHQGRYLRFIDEFLVNSRPSDQIRTYSAGVGGDRTDLCLDRLARDVDSRQPDVIAIMLGMNDCMNEGAATNYEANVVRLVTRLKASNPQARFIWMTPSPYDSGVSLSPDRLGPHPERAERLRQYAAFLRAWQREHGGLLVDFNAAMEDFNRTAQTEDQTFTLCGADRVHPQDIGGYFMARVFLRDVGLLSWKVPQSIVALKSDFETWQTRNDTPAGRLVVERNREQAEFRTLHMIRWQLETLERRNADDFAALRALESSFNGRSGQFEDRVRRYLKEWPRVHETDRRLDEMWTRAYSVALDDAQYDLVIYGGSPAAITAAIKAKVMGLRPIIVSPKTHLGGLSVSGLGFTDSGNTSAIGGLAREFYRRIYRAYQDPSAWRWQKREDFAAAGQGTKAVDDAERTMWTFEPHVAEFVFAAWLSEKGVEVRRGEFLDRENGVEKKDGRIVSITTRAGNRYSGRYFIDATYEGDLMAAAGVAYRVGREGNDEYGETWNGNQVGVLHHSHHFRDWKVSPYKVSGDSTSGLCAEVESSAPGVRGEADARVQAYCYRLCLTDDPRNRIPFEKPEGYDPSRYTLLARVYERGYTETFSKFDRIANHKTDTNNHGPMNMDYIGHSSVWPEASDARRVELEKEHRDYQKGLLYFIANDLSVPERVRQEMSKWGLAKDEFVDNGGWPYELYVREGRRMVGEYVMTEHDCLDEKTHPNQGHSYGPVGMGSYALDSHNVRRYVTDEGYVQNEGDIGVKAKKPYGIDYGAIVPKRADCTNLLVPVALSATHTAFGSIRMEPVFMILGESAATAVALAAKGDRAVQDVPYVELSGRLEADGQRLQLRKDLSSSFVVAAKSIWPKGLADEMNTLIAFRSEFTAKADDNVCLDLVAWYSYRVTLNGRFVAFGPARGPKGHFRPDELKLSVCDGENHLQIEVAGYNVPNFYLMEQHPFFKAMVRVNGNVAAVSHRDFRAWRLPRVQKAPRYSFQRTFAEIYDVSGAEIGPLELVAAPEPKLIARVVPYPDYEVRAPIPISSADVCVDLSRKTYADRSLALPGQAGSGFKGFRMEELTLNSAYLAQRLAYANRREATPEERAAKSFELTSGRSVVFDNGVNDTGFPEFSITVKKPGRIALTFDEVLTDGEVRGIDRYRDCCNVIVWNLESPGTYKLSSFEPYTMRYFDMGLLEGEAKVTDVRFRSYKNATAKVAKFRASDPVLARIFEAAKETFRQNAVDVFTDCPSRERAGWNCDAYFTGPVSTLLTGNTDLERVFEECIALPASFDNLPDGMIPMCYPADHTSGNFIPNWAMWFVLETEEYLARSGDRALVNRLRPRFEKLVSYLWTFRNSDGLLERLPKWVFVEWSRSNKLVQDVNYPSNMTWAKTLDTMARLYGRTELAEEAERVRETVRRQSWTGQWFCDNAVRQVDGALKLSGECTETCQYYAFFFGTATKERYPGLWRTLLADFGPQRLSEDRKTLKSHPDIWPSNAFIGNYLRLKLLEREGLGNRILSETKGYFQYMADRTGTLWENATTCASCNHGFASYVAVLLIRSVLGIEKIDLVNRTVTVRDTGVDLDFCEAELPTPDGMLSVSWRMVDGVKERKVSAPDGWRVKKVRNPAE